MSITDFLNSPAYRGWRRDLSLAVLIAVNVLPIYGVLKLDWDVGALMVLYWSENLVIGFYTLLRMLVVSPVGGIFSGLFFTVHYGGFCAVHGLFILSMLFEGQGDAFPRGDWPFVLVFVELLVNVVRQVLAMAPSEWIVAFAGLMLSHGVSFVANFLVAGERHRANIGQLMSAPYGRVVLLHVAVLFGGFAVMALGQPIGMLLVLVLGKIGVDVAMHVREHRTLGSGGDDGE